MPAPASDAAPRLTASPHPQYRPQLFIRTADVTVSLSHLPGTEDADEKMVMPGDSIEMVGELVHDVALETGSRFTLREGGKTGECLGCSSALHQAVG